MINLRTKKNPKKVLSLQEVVLDNYSVLYAGKMYNVPKDIILRCKLGQKVESLSPSQVTIDHKDNIVSNMKPIRALNCYKFKIENNKINLYYCLAISSKTLDGMGIGEAISKVQLASFNSVDILKDFCKKFNLNLSTL